MCSSPGAKVATLIGDLAQYTLATSTGKVSSGQCAPSGVPNDEHQLNGCAILNSTGMLPYKLSQLPATFTLICTVILNLTLINLDRFRVGLKFCLTRFFA